MSDSSRQIENSGDFLYLNKKHEETISNQAQCDCEFAEEYHTIKAKKKKKKVAHPGGMDFGLKVLDIIGFINFQIKQVTSKKIELPED